MGFGSAILADIWRLETTQDATVFWAKREAIIAKFARVEDTLVAEPFFAGERFSLVDAVFGRGFRYFDTFDAIIDLGAFAATPKIGTWRAALAARPSVRDAVSTDYPERLRALDGQLLQRPRSVPSSPALDPRRLAVAKEDLKGGGGSLDEGSPRSLRQRRRRPPAVRNRWYVR
jgi:hypothetical protein